MTMTTTAAYLLVIFASTYTGNVYTDVVPFNTESACIIARQVVLTAIRDSGRQTVDFDAFCVSEGDNHEPEEPDTNASQRKH